MTGLPGDGQVLKVGLGLPHSIPQFGDLIDAEEGAAHDDLVLEALTDQSLLDGATGVLGDLVEQDDACRVVVRVRSEDGDGDDQAQPANTSFT
ncbi:hypothetical protein OG214_00215 [Streptomyces sp. NBC_00872]|nr:hypothetical protein OG214_00215 [Streptomyces sp. NBC_00872]